jgi:hypothetical protein
LQMHVRERILTNGSFLRGNRKSDEVCNNSFYCLR